MNNLLMFRTRMDGTETRRVPNTCATQERQRRLPWSWRWGRVCKTVGSACAMTIVAHFGMPGSIP
jgi:hypothetical protein